MNLIRAQHLQSLFVKIIRGGNQSMPKGDKGAYTDKQKRKAEHIEEGYEKWGVNCVSPGPVWTPLNPSDKPAKDVARFGVVRR